MLGSQIAAEVNARIPLVRDPVTHRYVNALGRVLASKSERPELGYYFYVIDSDAVNAFALPGGHIYVNRGLIERTENISELSAILAHEIGHVASRHGARMLERRLRTGSVVSILYDLILGAEPQILEQSSLQMGRALWTASHSREAELEADERAVEYLIEAGVDPRGMITLLTGLLLEEQASGPRPSLEWFATHPMTRNRIALTRDEIGDELPESAGRLATDIPSFRGFLARIRLLPPPPHSVQPIP